MSLPDLAARVSTLPLILCGPILRRVTPTSVTVWLALSKPYRVTLTVHDTDGEDRTTDPHLISRGIATRTTGIVVALAPDESGVEDLQVGSRGVYRRTVAGIRRASPEGTGGSPSFRRGPG